MADPITPEVSQRICTHMNEDHAEAVLVYAKVYGKTANATAAVMKSIDPEGMDLEVSLTDAVIPLRISFDHPLTDSEDAHQTLIGMVRQARTAQA
jgi:putative heme iron utilization protein